MLNKIDKASALHGMAPVANKGINLTFVGPVKLAGNTTSKAIIKDIGAQEIAKEAFAAVLGRAMGLPIPTPLLVGVDKAIITPVNATGLSDGNTYLFFGSQLVGPPTLAQLCINALASKIVNELINRWPAAGEGYAFDTWIANIDRNTNNIMFDGINEVWLIDHGLAFTGNQLPNGKAEAGHEFPNKMDLWLIPNLDSASKTSFANSINNLVTMAGSLNLKEIVESCQLTSLLGQNDRTAITEFVEERLNHVRALAATSSGLPIPMV